MQWLLSTRTLRLVDASDLRQPSYAILSHRWGSDELTFDYLQGHAVDDAQVIEQCQEGSAKVLGFCRIASRDGYEYAWVDTCCIDKKSSAELSEAITSMFRYYKNAKKCYVYLADLKRNAHSREFCASAWFGRGWTLQELLAPPELEFYTQDWELYGTLMECIDDVCRETSIPVNILKSKKNILTRLAGCSVAAKMSWAARRKTRRIEDEAYCLLGIFNVFMPIMYGEGRNAFARLQKSIFEQCSDPTIFAWKAKDSSIIATGLFAFSPADFETTGSYVPVLSKKTTDSLAEARFNSLGLLLEPEVYDLNNNIQLPGLDSTVSVPIYALPIGCKKLHGEECTVKIVLLTKHYKAMRVDANELFNPPSSTLDPLTRVATSSTIRLPEIRYIEPFGR